MSEEKLAEVRVDVLLRAFANRLLKCGSPVALLRAVQWVAGKFGFSVVCVAPVAAVRVRTRGEALSLRQSRAQRELLDALSPLRDHPLFVESLASSATVTGTQMRQRRGLTPSAWQKLLPAALRGRETLSFMVRFEDQGRWRAAWFVLLTVRTGRASGLARSFLLVATHLAHDRFRAMTEERCGRVASAWRANEALRLIAREAGDVEVVPERASPRPMTRRGGARNRNN